MVATDHFISGKRFECKQVVNEKTAKKQAQEQKKQKVFLGGLHKSITEDQLENHFSQYGTLIRTVVNRTHKNNESRGSGFLLFDDPAVAEKVIQLGEVKVEGFPVTCQPCLLREELMESSSSQELSKTQQKL